MPIGSFSISNLPAVPFDGVWRVLACLPSSKESLSKFSKFSSSFKSLAPSEWQEIDFSNYDFPILDQGSTSACTAFASTAGCEMSLMQSGRPLHEFSPLFLYGLVNNGADRGSSISDAMNSLIQTGICTKGLIPDGMMFKTQFPQSAFDDAKNHKLVKAYHCQTFEDICSAIVLGFPTILGIQVGSNFSQLDSEGVAPLPAGGGGGHALLGCGLKKSQQYGWVIKLRNSWGIRYGLKGYCYIRKEAFNYMGVDSFAIQEMGGSDPDTPVVPG